MGDSLLDDVDAPPAEVPAVVPPPAVQPGRDPRTGQFLPGNRLSPGRTSNRPDLVAVAHEWAQRHGTSVRFELGEVVGAMFAKAKEGDVAAASLILNRLAMADSSLVAAFSVEMSDVERTVRLQAILATAAARITEQANED